MYDLGLPFSATGSAYFFEKSGAPAGRRRRIGGLVTTETRDRQNEVILQRGIDWSGFNENGWFNDDHTRGIDGIVGYPDGPPQYIKKGEQMPNGKPAPANGHWAEGYLLKDDPRADKIWQKAQSLKGTGRSLGFSIEGRIKKRSEADKKIVAKAMVQNIAVTGSPINGDSELEVLARSLTVIEEAQDPVLVEFINKALTMGSPAPGGGEPEGPVSGEGAGQIITPESLDKKEKKQTYGSEKEKKQKKNLTKAEAFAALADRYPEASCATLGRIIDLTLARLDG